jgi:hypothetical protein
VLVVVISRRKIGVEPPQHILGRKQELSRVDSVRDPDRFFNEAANGREIPQIVPAIIGRWEPRPARTPRCSFG